jgi:K+-transporting ATPase ATPase C chain
MRSQLRPAFMALIMLTVITGLIYPAIVTGIAKIAFTDKAEGSLVGSDEKVVGSELIGQQFTDPKYFWPRSSATSPMPYNAAAASGSNLSSTNPAQLEVIQQRVAALQAANPENHEPVPIDLVTASGSGLDPHISVAAARYQARRVARLRKMSTSEMESLVQHNTEGLTLGVLGDERVNVLKLNLALDARVQ